MLSSPIRIRRPKGPGADPKVGPGGVDYQSNPLPNKNFDCRDPKTLFTSWNHSRVRSCLRSIRKKQKVLYVLKEKPEPYFELEIDEEETPKCLIRVMPKIPVPREFFFQATSTDVDPSTATKSLEQAVANVNQKAQCYSTRLPLEDGKILGTKLFPSKLMLKFEFPLPRIPRTRPEFLRTAIAWSLTPFYYMRNERGAFEAQWVPNKFCQTCFGKGKPLKTVNSSYPRWPNDSQGFLDEEH